MFDESYQKHEVVDFAGAWLITEETDVPPQGALLARNMRFQPGQASTRLGHSVVFNPNDTMTSGFNWVFADPVNGSKNLLLWYASGYGGVRYAELQAPGSGTNLYTQAAFGASFAPSGSRIFIAHYSLAGIGQGHGRVFGYGVGSDNLFARPMLTTEVTLTATEPSAGVITAGLHNIGFIMTSRNGYTGRFAPADTSLVFQPLAFTSAGAKNLQVTVTPTGTWPSWAGTIQLIMTTTGNPSLYYFVPGAIASVPAGGSFAVIITANISDDDLTTYATPATPYRDLLTIDSTNNPPFSPAVVAEAGNRMAYHVNNSSLGQCVVFSEPNNHQAITADQHVVYMPGGRQTVTSCFLRGLIYIFGPFWTYSVRDTGDVPVTWGAPGLVDGRIGTLSPYGVDVNVAEGVIWVASQSGLYRFTGGHYDFLPISYYQTTDWARINWKGAAVCVQVSDDAVNKAVRVAVPLDGATANTVIFEWDYTNGTLPEQAKYSTRDIANYGPGMMVMAQNDTTRKIELWLGPTTNGNVLRANDGSEAQPYRDMIAAGSPRAIDSRYKTAAMPTTGESQGDILTHHGSRQRLRGSGVVNLSLQSLDGVLTATMAPKTLTPGPGTLYDCGAYLINEYAHYSFDNGAVLDAWFSISMLTHFYSFYSMQG